MAPRLGQGACRALPADHRRQSCHGVHPLAPGGGRDGLGDGSRCRPPHALRCGLPTLRPCRLRRPPAPCRKCPPRPRADAAWIRLGICGRPPVAWNRGVVAHWSQPARIFHQRSNGSEKIRSRGAVGIRNRFPGILRGGGSHCGSHRQEGENRTPRRILSKIAGGRPRASGGLALGSGVSGLRRRSAPGGALGHPRRIGEGFRNPRGRIPPDFSRTERLGPHGCAGHVGRWRHPKPIAGRDGNISA